MAAGANFRTTIVIGLKIILPIAALVTLSTLFLFSGKVDVTASIPYAENRVDELIASERIAAPVLTGITKSNTAYMIASDVFENVTTSADAITAKNITSVFDLAQNQKTQITALTGLFSNDSLFVELSDSVTIVRTDGTLITSNQLYIDLVTGVLTSPTPIQAKTPFGTLDAGSMILTFKGPTEQVLFKDSVKLLYQRKR